MIDFARVNRYVFTKCKYTTNRKGNVMFVLKNNACLSHVMASASAAMVTFALTSTASLHNCWNAYFGRERFAL